jgi:hypothetical protein
MLSLWCQGREDDSPFAPNAALSYGPLMEQFDMEDLNRDFLSPEARDAMLELILAWAYLEGSLGLWIGTKFDIPADKAAILLGRTDAKGKLHKLQKLYSIEGHDKIAKAIRKNADSLEKQARARNTLAHAGCLGSLHSNPDRIVFAAYEAHGLGQLSIEVVPLSAMKASAQWARRYSETVHGIIQAIERDEANGNR